MRHERRDRDGFRVAFSIAASRTYVATGSPTAFAAFARIARVLFARRHLDDDDCGLILQGHCEYTPGMLYVALAETGGVRQVPVNIGTLFTMTALNPRKRNANDSH